MAILIIGENMKVKKFSFSQQKQGQISLYIIHQCRLHPSRWPLKKILCFYQKLKKKLSLMFSFAIGPIVNENT